MGSTKGDHATGEAVNFLVLLQTAPVMPARFIVLAVGVVVATLRAAQFIASKQHRHAARYQQGEQEVFDLAFPDGPDLSIFCFSFNAVILAEIFVGPIAIAFSVAFIMLVSITYQIMQGEAIVTGDEIDAAPGTFAGLGVNVSATADAAGK